MINHIFQLIEPRRFNVKFAEIDVESGVVVRPTYLSICAADQRYYMGRRNLAVLKEKLPMALIHEATGEVVYDSKGILAPGTKVMMVPNAPYREDEYVTENYIRPFNFAASSMDGFMQEFVVMPHTRLVECEGIIPEVASLGELLSVGMHAVKTFMNRSHKRRDTIGVWGDGNVGFVVALLVKALLPESKLCVFGMDPYKLEYFTFADQIVNLAEGINKVSVDHAFECVGGMGCESAIEHIIGCIEPEGTLTLMGVSENKVPIETRMVLEKGLTLIGRSRSGRADFEDVARVLKEDEHLQMRVYQIISQIIPVQSIKDMAAAFDSDTTVPFKTVMKWQV